MTGLEVSEALQLIPESWPPVGDDCDDERVKELGDDAQLAVAVDTDNSLDLIIPAFAPSSGRQVSGRREALGKEREQRVTGRRRQQQ